MRTRSGALTKRSSAPANLPNCSPGGWRSQPAPTTFWGTPASAPQSHPFASLPASIRRGRYLLPEAPGYSIEIYPESLDLYRYPDGAVWQEDSKVEATANGWRSSRDEV